MISGIFYFLYFAAFGIYVPYWTLYLHHLQFSPVQIATIYSIPSVARSFLPVLYGYLADRFRARRSFLMIAATGQVLPLVLLIWLHSYSWILLLISVFSIFNVVILPFTEAMVQEEQEKGSLDYGRTRLWGTFSFILLAVFFGKLLDHVSDKWILYGFISFLFGLALVTFRLPRGRVEFEFREQQLRQVLFSRKASLFFICSFLMYMSHGALYGFYSILLNQLGVKQSTIGLHWAVAASSEVLIFFFAAAILRAFRLSVLFSFCLIVAALRWFLIYSTNSPHLLLAAQCLHAFTFGAFHITSMRLIHLQFPTGSRSFGQALYASSTSGLGSVFGVMLSGQLWSSGGPIAFLYSGAAALIAFVLSLFLWKPEPRAVDLKR